MTDLGEAFVDAYHKANPKLTREEATAHVLKMVEQIKPEEE